MYLFFLVGQRVIPDLFFTCGNCYYCHVAPDTQCINFAGLLGVLNDGAFAEHFVVPTENLFVLPNQVSIEDVISMLTTRILPPPIAETSPLEMVNQAPNLMKTGEINSRVVINNYINILSLMLNNLN